MIEVVSFKKEHMKQLLSEPHNQYLGSLLSDAQIEATEKSGLARTILRAHTKEVLFCGGVSLYWPGRGECWAIFTKDCKREFMAIHRAVLAFFNYVPVKRIEASVEAGFEKGYRWIKALGFSLDVATAKSYLPNGNDASLYSRVK